MYRAAEYADRRRPRLRRRAERRGDARQPRRLQQRPAPTARSAAARPTRTWRAFARCATASSPTAPPCCAPRSTWRARTSTCATRRSTASSAPTHHNTGDKWCIYPMYTYAHPIEDALENITHSICTLEFEDQRPFYDWLLDTLCRSRPARAAAPAPVRVRAPQRHLRDHQQAQAASSWSTRSIVDGWDDPRMPTIVGLRRRGYTPESAAACSASASASTKADSWIDYASLEAALRDDLDPKAPRAMAVLDPVKLVLTNWAELFGSDGAPRALPRAGASAAPRARQRATSTSAPSSGSSATTSPKCRPRASSASSPATRCA